MDPRVQSDIFETTSFGRLRAHFARLVGGIGSLHAGGRSSGSGMNVASRHRRGVLNEVTDRRRTTRKTRPRNWFSPPTSLTDEVGFGIWDFQPV